MQIFRYLEEEKLYKFIHLKGDNFMSVQGLMQQFVIPVTIPPLPTELLACGNNATGELGLGDTLRRTRLTGVSSLRWKKIACGRHHTLSLIHI